MVQCIFWKSKWETFDNFSMVQLLTADHSGGHYDRTYVHQSLSPRHHHILDQHVFRLYAYEIFCQSNCSLTTTSWTIRAQSIACVWVFVMEWKVVTQLYLSLRIGLAVQCYFFKCFRRKNIINYITLYNRPQTLLSTWRHLKSWTFCNNMQLQLLHFPNICILHKCQIYFWIELQLNVYWCTIAHEEVLIAKIHSKMLQ